MQGIKSFKIWGWLHDSLFELWFYLAYFFRSPKTLGVLVFVVILAFAIVVHANASTETAKGNVVADAILDFLSTWSPLFVLIASGILAFFAFLTVSDARSVRAREVRVAWATELSDWASRLKECLESNVIEYEEGEKHFQIQHTDIGILKAELEGLLSRGRGLTPIMRMALRNALDRLSTVLDLDGSGEHAQNAANWLHSESVQWIRKQAFSIE